MQDNTVMKPSVSRRYVDSVSFRERFDRLEADFNRRFNQLMKLHEASICKPDTAAKAPVVSLVEPTCNDAAHGNNDVKLQPSVRQHVAPLN